MEYPLEFWHCQISNESFLCCVFLSTIPLGTVRYLWVDCSRTFKKRSSAQ